MKPEMKANAGLAPKYTRWALIALGALAVTACSKDKDEKVRFSIPPAQKTAATDSSASENQTDFIMEGYLAPDERLKRRQARLSAMLAQETTPATAPTTTPK